METTAIDLFAPARATRSASESESRMNKQTAREHDPVRRREAGTHARDPAAGDAERFARRVAHAQDQREHSPERDPATMATDLVASGVAPVSAAQPPTPLAQAGFALVDPIVARLDAERAQQGDLAALPLLPVPVAGESAPTASLPQAPVAVAAVAQSAGGALNAEPAANAPRGREVQRSTTQPDQLPPSSVLEQPDPLGTSTSQAPDPGMSALAATNQPSGGALHDGELELSNRSQSTDAEAQIALPRATTAPGGEQAPDPLPSVTAEPQIERTGSSDPAPTTARSQGPADAELAPAERALTSQISRGLLQQGLNGERTLSLRLTPPELGTVRVEVVEQAGSLHVRISAEDEGVRAALERGIHAIRQDLRAANAPVADLQLADDHLEFFHHEQDRGDGTQAGAQHQSHGRRGDDGARFSLEPEVDESPVPIPSRAGLRARVDAASVDAHA